MRKIVAMTVSDDVLYVVASDGAVLDARLRDVPLEFRQIGTVPEPEAAEEVG